MHVKIQQGWAIQLSIQGMDATQMLTVLVMNRVLVAMLMELGVPVEEMDREFVHNIVEIIV
tara:strand:+ start:252 stop:434 length:183 start_codon:yes stop_codon:yes gene_type:complete